MGKPVSIGQSHNVISVLANNVDWSKLDADKLQRQIVENSQLIGVRFTEFLRLGGRFKSDSKVFILDRRGQFDLSKVRYMNGWSVLASNAQALALDRIDLDKSKLVPWRPRDSRKKALDNTGGQIPLDAATCCFLVDNQNLIPESWEVIPRGYKNTIVFFQGSLIIKITGSSQDVAVLGLNWSGAEWSLCYELIDRTDITKVLDQDNYFAAVMPVTSKEA